MAQLIGWSNQCDSHWLERSGLVDTHHIGLLRCGHWFRESWPAGMTEPESGDLRVCAHPDHYPTKYPTFYFPDDKRFLVFLALAPASSVSSWEDAFHEWYSLRSSPLGTLPDIRREMAQCWLAALESITLDRPSNLGDLKVEETARNGLGQS